MKNMYHLFVVIVFTTVFTLIGCDDSGKELPVYEIGETGPSGSGIVFYVTDGGRHGMEAASENMTSSWSNKSSTWLGSTEKTIGTGYANTLAIIGQEGHTSSAALKCRQYRGGGKTDWYLPSSDELVEMYKQRALINDFIEIEGTYYNSSSEGDTYYSIGMATTSGKTYTISKSINNYFRPVRSF